MSRAVGKVQRERIYVYVRRYFYNYEWGTAEDIRDFIKHLDVIDKDNKSRHRFIVPNTRELAYILKHYHHPILGIVRAGWNGSRTAVYGRTDEYAGIRTGTSDIKVKRGNSKVPEMCSTQDGYQQGNIQGRTKSNNVVRG